MSGEAKRGLPLERYAPLVLILGALGGAYALGLHKQLSFEALRAQRETLTSFVAEHPAQAIAIYLAVYAAFTASMIPGALWITIAGGFLFGLAGGTLLTVTGATLGATGLFLAARSAFGEPLRRRAGPFLKKLEAGFAENPFSYMLSLRFLPVVPFPVANVAPAFLGAKLRDYMIATFIGIIPGTLAYTWIGSGLGAAFDAGREPEIGAFIRQLLPAFFALGAVSLLPVFIKRFTRKKEAVQ
jgi:uncharacterized membrane protein YdjX (TVP38/TMEM64 family)